MKGWEIDNKFVQHRDYSRSSPQVIIMLTNKITQYSQSLWYFSNWKDLKMFVFYCVLFGSFKDEKKLYFRIKSIDKKLCLCLNQAGRDSEADMAAVCTNTISQSWRQLLFISPLHHIPEVGPRSSHISFHPLNQMRNVTPAPFSSCICWEGVSNVLKQCSPKWRKQGNSL